MARASDERIAWWRRAVDRAQAFGLQPGDKITASHSCSEHNSTVRFTHWEGSWICSKTVSDISPTRVVKVNGKPVDFTNGEPMPA